MMKDKTIQKEEGKPFNYHLENLVCRQFLEVASIFFHIIKHIACCASSGPHSLQEVTNTS